MGCSCKENKTTKKVKEPVLVMSSNKNEIEIFDIPKPTYTIEDIIRMKDYVSSISRTEIERSFVSDMLLRHFGDIVPAYCDTICFKHIKERISYMETKLAQYELFLMMKR
jgi:hypothetical protein